MASQLCFLLSYKTVAAHFLYNVNFPDWLILGNQKRKCFENASSIPCRDFAWPSWQGQMYLLKALLDS
jgi:hypothetical protein